MKKTSFLTSLVAVCVACSANAASDVTFAGTYHLNETTELNVNDSLPGTTYSYTASDGPHDDVAYNTAPDATLFTYTGPDGVADGSNLSTDAPAQSDFTGESAANGTTVFTEQTTLVSGETVDQSNYSYVSGDGNTVTLGDTAIPMTETVALNSTYTNGHTIDVTNGNATESIQGSWYTYTTSSNSVYHLSDDGTQLLNIDNVTQTPDAGSELADAFEQMKTAYTADSAALASAITTTADQWTTEQANFAAARTAVETDTATVATLNHNYGTLNEALDLYQAAQAAQATAGEAQAADVATQNAALAVYNAPIEETITNGANDAIDASIESGSIKTALDGKADATDVATNTANIATNTSAIETNAANITANTNAIADNTSAIETNAGNIATNTSAIETNAANIATNTADIATNTSAIADNAAKIETNTANIATNTADIATNTSAIETNAANIAANTGAISAETERATGVENALQTQLNNAIADARAADIDTLKSANAYTDKMIGDLDQDLSSGVAGAVALSSVAVSNVKRGEVSVGGGYGYYNNQSAFALGAAMGLTDNWSINAGAGLGINGGNLSVRAGTNYKFKLF